MPGGGVWSGSSVIDDCDAVLVRMVPPGSLERVIARVDVLHRLELLGPPVINSARAIESCVDKYLALARIEAAGLPVPPTFSGESARDALAAFHELGGDCIVKPLFGSEGRGLVRVSDPELAGRVFRAIEAIQGVLYVQKVIDHGGFDYRYFVISGRVSAAMRRHARAGDWRTNLAQGGRGESIAPSRALTDLAVRAAAATGAVVAGVDLIVESGSGRPFVLEVNAVPGWRGLAEASGIDVAREILAWIKDCAK